MPRFEGVNLGSVSAIQVLFFVLEANMFLLEELPSFSMYILSRLQGKKHFPTVEVGRGMVGWPQRILLQGGVPTM